MQGSSVLSRKDRFSRLFSTTKRDRSYVYHLGWAREVFVLRPRVHVPAALAELSIFVQVSERGSSGVGVWTRAGKASASASASARASVAVGADHGRARAAVGRRSPSRHDHAPWVTSSRVCLFFRGVGSRAPVVGAARATTRRPTDKI